MLDSLAISVDDFLAGPGSACAPSAEPDAPPEDLRAMAEIGMAALGAGMGSPARPIFVALDMAQPDNAAGPIGLALIDAMEGRDRESIDRLRRASQRRSCGREARAILCILLAQAGRRAEAQQIRREILRGPDCGARRMIAAFGGGRV